MIKRNAMISFLCFVALWAAVDAGSGKICYAETTYNKMKLAHGVLAGKLINLGETYNFSHCISMACNKDSGDHVYLLESWCFLIDCYSENACRPVQETRLIKSIVVRLHREGSDPTTSATTQPTKTPQSETLRPSPQTSSTEVASTQCSRDKKDPRRGPDGKIAMSAEHRLVQNVIYNSTYNKDVRPVVNDDDVMKVVFTLKLVQIVDVDEKAESLKVNVWTRQEWRDPFLTWDPRDYDGIRSINVDPSLVWLPIIILFNNAAKSFTGGLEKYKTKVVIGNNGTVTWFAATQFISSCKLNIRYFPFDDQYCYLKFGSWTYTTQHLDMSTPQKNIDLSSYMKNGEWEILRVPVTENKILYSCCKYPFADITFTIHIKRKVQYYVFNLIIPSTILVFFILVGFCLPADSGERIALNITVLLSLTVFLNIVSNTLPSTSDSISLLGYYYLILMIEVCLAIVATCVVLRYSYCGPKRMSARVRSIVNEWIAGFMFFVITRKPANVKDIAGYCKEGWERARSAVESCRQTADTGTNSTVGTRSYAVQTGNGPTDEHLALITRTPEAKRFVTIPEEPSKIATAPQKWKSEPAINSAGFIMESKVHPRRASECARKPANSLQRGINEAFDVLTKKVKEDDEEEEILLEWQFASLVLDRLFFLVFIIGMIIPLLFFFLDSPTPIPSETGL